MDETEKTVTLRRKGRPPKPDVEPMVKKVLRCLLFWIPFASLAVFLSMFWIWAMHNIRLVVEGTKAIAEMSAGNVDPQAARNIAEETLRILQEAPAGATCEYTADEQVVLLGRYQAVEENEDWKKLHGYFYSVSAKYVYAEEFSLVFYDRESERLIWLVSPNHPTGYCAYRKDIAFPDESGYDLGAFVGHREGTAVIVPVAVSGDGTGICVLGSFSFAGIMGSEAHKLLIPILLGLLVTIGAALRIISIFWQRRMQEELLQKQEDDQEEVAGKSKEDRSEDGQTKDDGSEKDRSEDEEAEVVRSEEDQLEENREE